jgi:hypothetical protein
MFDDTRLKLDKLDAARRQLSTAIALWFKDGDPVAIHTLACAAYEIIHTVSKKRNPSRRPLLLDLEFVHPDIRKEFRIALKHPANFFKHADRDSNDEIEFNPRFSEFFILFSILGIEFCGESQTTTERAWMTWFCLRRPDLLSANFQRTPRKSISSRIPRLCSASPKERVL